MTPWWSEQAGGLVGGIGGSVLGIAAGCFGAAVGTLVPQGRGKRAVLAIHTTLVCVGAVLLLSGLAALVLGQPYHVWYPLVLMGFIVTLVLGLLLPKVRRGYRAAEERKMEAAALRRS